MRIINTETNEIFTLKYVENKTAYFESENSSFELEISNLDELVKSELNNNLSYENVDILTNSIKFKNNAKSIYIEISSLKEKIYNQSIALLGDNFQLSEQENNWLFQNLEIPRKIRIFIPDNVYVAEKIKNSPIAQLFDTILPLVTDYIVPKTGGNLVYLERISFEDELLLSDIQEIIIEKL